MTKAAEENRIAKADRQLAELSEKLNRYNLKTKEQIEAAIKKATKGAPNLLKITIIEDKKIVQSQVGPGKPGPNTQYRGRRKHLLSSGMGIGS